jgi:hypothetical protein
MRAKRVEEAGAGFYRMAYIHLIHVNLARMNFFQAWA